jgi:pre-mRNA-splicing factor ISY1
MARNQEKAQTMLARFRALKQAELFGDPKKERRPYMTTDCSNLQEAERWRRQILKEISKKVSQIQNPGMGEYQTRDLNDEINKLIREKGAWEHRIIELGGPNYLKMAPRIVAKDGKEVAGNKGYKYFGAAKDLPGVRDLLEAQRPESLRKTRYEMYKHVDADYYGYRDDEDGLLIQLELEQEKKIMEEYLKENPVKRKRADDDKETEDKIAKMYKMETDRSIEEDEEDAKALFQKNEEKRRQENIFKSHVPVPSQDEIQKFILERKKQILLQKYVSDDLNKEELETKQLTGRN